MTPVFNESRLLFNMIRSKIQSNNNHLKVATSRVEEQESRTVIQPLEVFLPSANGVETDGMGSKGTHVVVYPGSSVDGSFLTDDSVIFSAKSDLGKQYRATETTGFKSYEGDSRFITYKMEEKVAGNYHRFKNVAGVRFPV